MTDLQELSKLIDGYKLRQIEVLTRPLRPGVTETRYKIMYHALIDGRAHTEAEAAQLLGLDPHGRPFRRFLFEFRRRLFAPLLFLDTESSLHFNPTQKANFECLRKLATFQTLVYRNCLENASIVAEEVLALAAAHDVTLVALEMTTFLRRYYIEQSPNPERYQAYQVQMRQYRFDWAAENKALAYYQAASAPAMKTKSTQVELVSKTQYFVQALASEAQTCQTIIFLAGYYGLKFMEKMHAFRWEECIAVCDEAIVRLSAKTCSTPRLEGIFYGHKIVCLYMLENYAEALRLNSENIQREIAGSRGWFLALETHILIALKAGNYELALETAQTAYTHPSFGVMPHLLQESWKILSAYLVFVQSMIQTKSNLSELENWSKFKIRKFLNDVPTFSKDKKGLNLPILIIQFLFLLLHKDFDRAQEQLIALRKYRLKHLKTEQGYYRTQLFIRALCTLAASAFHRHSFLKKSTPYLAEMAQIPKGYPDQHYRIEIIPYEVLWKWVAELLD
jgi:hypothetical protein